MTPEQIERHLSAHRPIVTRANFERALGPLTRDGAVRIQESETQALVYIYGDWKVDRLAIERILRDHIPLGVRVELHFPLTHPFRGASER